MPTTLAPFTPAAMRWLPDLLFSSVREKSQERRSRPRPAFQPVMRRDLFAAELGR